MDALDLPHLPPLSLRARAALAIDPRALVAFRVAMALTILTDLVSRAADLTSFYTDRGLLPREALRAADGAFHVPSLHLLGGSFTFELTLFALASLAAIALAAGYKPRLAAILSWAFAVSLRHRNPAVLSGGDLLLATLLLASALAPLDLRAPRVPTHSSSTPSLAGPGSALLLAQIAAVHFFAGLLKLVDSPAWRDGTAVRRALEDVAATPLGIAIHAHPDLCKALTWTVLALEILGPIALLAPSRTSRPRAAAALAFLSLHAAIAATLLVGIFPLVCAASMIAFIPASIWDRLQIPTPPNPGPPHTSRTVTFSAALFALIALLTNASSLIPTLKPPRLLDSLGLAQDWSMYIELTDPNGWYEITGIREGGARTPLLPEAAPPTGAPHRYKNRRWHAYMTTFSRDPWLRWWSASSLCARDREAHPTDPISRIEIRFYCVHNCDLESPLDPLTCPSR